jgi:hypothetical protein
MAVVTYLGLDSLRQWHAERCEPIVAALFEKDRARAERLLAQNREQLAADTHWSPDERRCLDYVLLDYGLSIVDAFEPPNAIGAQFAATYVAITGLLPAGPQSDTVQARMLIDMIGAGTRRGYVTATQPEVDALLARIPEAYLTPNVWYYITAWAFHYGYLKYLEQAMERQTVETTGWLDSYYWLRTNLMYLLVDGRAARLDVEKVLRGYDHPLQLLDFRNVLLPRCEQAGLMDAGLYELLERREAELAALDGTYPRLTPRTERVVTQY